MYHSSWHVKNVCLKKLSLWTKDCSNKVRTYLSIGLLHNFRYINSLGVPNYSSTCKLHQARNYSIHLWNSVFYYNKKFFAVQIAYINKSSTLKLHSASLVTPSDRSFLCSSLSLSSERGSGGGQIYSSLKVNNGSNVGNLWTKGISVLENFMDKIQFSLQSVNPSPTQEA
jgi:hypothetical protein